MKLPNRPTSLDLVESIEISLEVFALLATRLRCFAMRLATIQVQQTILSS